MYASSHIVVKQYPCHNHTNWQVFYDTGLISNYIIDVSISPFQFIGMNNLLTLLLLLSIGCGQMLRTVTFLLRSLVTM